MAISIGTIVDVDVSLQTAGIVTNGFNLPMFLGLHKGFTERFKIYSSVSEVGVDFATTSNEYKAAQTHFAQTPSTNRFGIGRQNSTTVTYTPVVANSTNYVVELEGTTFTFTSDSSATAAEIVTGLTTLINASAIPVTASGSSTLILTADVGGTPFKVKASTNLTPVYATTESLTDAVNAILLESPEWYGAMGYSHVKADQLELATALSAAKKVYITSTTDTVSINSTFSADTTSVVKAFNTNAYNRAGVFYSAVADTVYPEAGVFSRWFGQQAGRINMCNKRMAGIASDNLTDGQLANISSKYGNIYAPVVSDGVSTGTAVILSGTFGDGTFFDITRDVDFAVSDLQATVFNRFVNIDKIPMSPVGLALIEGAIEDSGRRMITQGIFQSYEVTMPEFSEISANDRALRKVTGITIVATLAGGINTCQINLAVGV